MFVFLLEVIAGEGPMTFFDLPKKRTPSTRPRRSARKHKDASSSAPPPVAASPAPPPPPVALTPMAHLDCLDQPHTLGPPLLPKFQYDAGKWAQKEQALADKIRIVSKWHPLHWVSAMVMNFLVWDLHSPQSPAQPLLCPNHSLPHARHHSWPPTLPLPPPPFSC
jgi:hypothetical protein